MHNSIISRFWSKVEKTGTCWNWNASVGTHGYGQFRVRRGEVALAHRFAYELTHGPIPTDARWCICHTCDNPPCVNPAHLWLGTAADNSDDKIQKGRLGDRAYGEFAYNAHLPSKDVQHIRHMYDTGQWRVRDVVRIYNLDQGYASRLVHRIVRKRG